MQTSVLFMCTGATATFSGCTSTVNARTSALHFSCTGTESNLLDCASYASSLRSFRDFFDIDYCYDKFVCFKTLSSDELCSYFWRQNAGVQCNGMFHLSHAP